MLFDFLSLTHSVQKGTNCYKLKNPKQENRLTVHILIKKFYERFYNYIYQLAIHACRRKLTPNYQGYNLQVQLNQEWHSWWKPFWSHSCEAHTEAFQHTDVSVHPYWYVSGHTNRTTAISLLPKNRHQQQHLRHQVMENIEPLAEGTPDSILL